MKDLLASIEKSLENKNWYAALAVALILPDICGKIDNPLMYSSKRYEAWFDKYVKKYYILQESIGSASIYGGDCYAIRCALLHEFNGDLSSHKARKILAKYKFCSPDTYKYGYEVHVRETGCEIKIRVDDFCGYICMGVNEWMRDWDCDVNTITQFVKIYDKYE